MKRGLKNQYCKSYATLSADNLCIVWKKNLVDPRSWLIWVNGFLNEDNTTSAWSTDSQAEIMYQNLTTKEQ